MSNNIYQRTKNFITKSKKLHKNKYDYSKVSYTNANIEVIIVCPIHGDFSQKPAKHYNRGHGCPKCGGTNKPSTDEFIKKAKEVHGNKYNYVPTNYKSSLEKIQIVCPVHGVFKQTPKDHLNGCGCSDCGGVPKITTKRFIVRATVIHNAKYDYSLVDYKSYNEKVTIICPIHGKFKQAPMVHFRGGGCSKCNLPGLYSERIFNENEELKTRSASLYLLKFINTKTGSEFLKIGITQIGIKSRFMYGYSNYEYEILVDKKMNLYEAFRLEQNILHVFGKAAFKPSKPFGGRNECLTLQYKTQIIKTLTTS